jgi:hypothetical protein
MTDFNTLGFTAKPRNPLYTGGKHLRTVHAQPFVDVSEVANGDVFILGRNIPLSARVHRIFAPNGTPALTAAADNDFGFYRKDVITGAMVEVDKDILIDGADLSSAQNVGDLLGTFNASLDKTKTIGELLNLQSDEAYEGDLYLCMTMNTAATTTDQTLDLDIVLEYATTN